MNKKIIGIFFGICLVIGAVGFVSLQSEDTKDTSRQLQTNKADPSKYVVKKACDILSLDDAKKLFGDDNVTITPEDNTGAQSNDIGVSSCSYIDKSMKAATILVRSAKTDAGQASNKAQFTQKRPPNTQDVSGYGEGAYWNLQLAQLNILKGNTWYILSYGAPNINQRTLGETEQMAKLISGKFDYAPGESY